MADGVLGGVRREYLAVMAVDGAAYLVAGAFLFASYAAAGFEVAVLVGLTILVARALTGGYE